jgi:hypothetical protein
MDKFETKIGDPEQEDMFRHTMWQPCERASEGIPEVICIKLKIGVFKITEDEDNKGDNTQGKLKLYLLASAMKKYSPHEINKRRED